MSLFNIQLANPNTPIQEWNIPGIPKGFSLSIKREDMTGSTLSGSKVTCNSCAHVMKMQFISSLYYCLGNRPQVYTRNV